MKQCESIHSDKTRCPKEATKTVKMTHTRFGEKIAYLCQEHFEMSFRIQDESGVLQPFDPSHHKIFTTVISNRPPSLGYYQEITLTQEDITDEMPPT